MQAALRRLFASMLRELSSRAAAYIPRGAFALNWLMLHEFVTSNRDELVRRCRSKVSTRDSPPLSPAGLDHGVPLVLEQLVWALRCEEESPASPRGANHAPSRSTPATVEVSRTAALHGKELREHGYTAGQVVQDYADISNAIAELAAERNAPVSVDELESLNRFLDSAIADAVASYGGLTNTRALFARP
jgi:hypothetical protein